MTQPPETNGAVPAVTLATGFENPIIQDTVGLPPSGDPFSTGQQAFESENLEANRAKETLLRLYDLYYAYFWEQFEKTLNLIYPEGPDGRRMPILHVEVDDEKELAVLEEAFRKWRLVQQGQLEPDEDVVRFEQNEANAQQRLLELWRRRRANLRADVEA